MLRRIVSIIPGITVERKHERTEMFIVHAMRICAPEGGISSPKGEAQHAIAAMVGVG